MRYPRPRFTQWPSADKRAAIADLCQTIRETIPNATETGGLPNYFRLNDVSLVAAGGSRVHCSFYVMSEAVIRAFSEELDEMGFRYTKITITFKPDAPLPADLVRRIVKARAEEHGGQARPARRKRAS